MSKTAKSMQPICQKCGKYPFVIAPHECPAKEPLDGSPLESVVQGRTESPVPSNPAVQGTPDLLAELRARAMHKKKRADAGASEASIGDFQYLAAYERGAAAACSIFLQWLDELAQPSENTAPDTTSGSAGVP